MKAVIGVCNDHKGKVTKQVKCNAEQILEKNKLCPEQNVRYDVWSYACIQQSYGLNFPVLGHWVQ